MRLEELDRRWLVFGRLGGWWTTGARCTSKNNTRHGGRCLLKTSGPALSESLRFVLWPRLAARAVVRAGALFTLLAIVAWTAVLTKRAHTAPPLVNVRSINTATAAPADEVDFRPVVTEVQTQRTIAPEAVPAAASANPLAFDANVRWFDGRPVRPARSMLMTVTAYSPDARSCDESADGKTATLHSVTTNGHKLVAADPKVLPYGAMVSMPGYDSGQIVPVLDCGGKIKGRKLDVLFPTHEEARRWGVRKIRVTLWEFADGKPAVNPRKLR